jgi:transcriptional regulator with XRE-family HTH domain
MISSPAVIGSSAGFARRCVELRRRLGLSRHELARWLGVSAAQVGAYECGRRLPTASLVRLFKQLENEAAMSRLPLPTAKPVTVPVPSGLPLPPEVQAVLDQAKPPVALVPAASSAPAPLPTAPSSPRSGPPTDLGRRVRALREQLGVTRPKLASMLGVCRQYVGKVEKGYRASLPFVKLVEKMEADLRGSRSVEKPIEKPAEKAVEPDRVWSADGGVAPPRLGYLPLLSQRDALLLANPGQAARHARDFVPFGVRDEAAFAVRVRGDAMLPQHGDGEIAVVYPGATPRSGDRVLVRVHDDIGGEVLFRVLGSIGPAGRITLSSPNPVYPSLTLERSQILWMCPVAATVRLLLE